MVAGVHTMRDIAEAFKTLPPLWSTESRETTHIDLTFRIRCAWHCLTWYPVEIDSDETTLYGLTTRIVPEWRHFSVSEVMRTYGGHRPRLDRGFVPARVPLVSEVRNFSLDDISPFVPDSVKDLGIDM